VEKHVEQQWKNSGGSTATIFSKFQLSCIIFRNQKHQKIGGTYFFGYF
jgi:hypothetical protein